MTALPATEFASSRIAPVLVVAAAAGLAVGAPLWTLLLGPIVFGVPHVLGDLRVLWLQRPCGLDGRTALAIALPVVALTAVRCASAVGLGAFPRVELACGVLAVAVGGLLGARTRGTRSLVLVTSLALLAAMFTAPKLAVVGIAHVHNLVAVAWLLALCGRAALPTAIAVVVVLLAIGAFATGPEAVSAAGLSWARCSQDLAPGLEVALADRLVRAFAFAQVVHYGLWTFVLPAQRGRSLRTELGSFGLRAAIVASIAVPLLALVDANGTRSAYLTLAIGHGWFEFAIAAFVFARRRRVA